MASASNITRVPTHAQPIDPQPAPAPIGPLPQTFGNPNIVVILLDDGGAEKFNWSGLLAPASGYPSTPRMDEMRARGVTFLRAYAHPICSPTRRGVQTGRFGFRAGLAGNIDAANTGFAFGFDGSTLRELLIAGALRRGVVPPPPPEPNIVPYAIGWFGKCHLCSDAGKETYAIDVGYDRYVGCQPNAASLSYWPPGQTTPTPNVPDDPNSGHFHFREVQHSAGSSFTTRTYGDATVWMSGAANPYYVAWNPALSPKAAWDAYKVVRDSIVWMNERTRPFFAMVCINPPHAEFEVPPFTIPDDVGFHATGEPIDLISPTTQEAMTALDGGSRGPGYRPKSGASQTAVFNANCEAFDTLIGLLWDRIEPTRRDNTLFILMGDNGTVSSVVEPPYDLGHAKRSIYEMGARVPMIVWGPPRIVTSPGRTSDHLVEVVDVFSTVMKLSRADPARWNPGNAIKIDGLSFANVLHDPIAPPARTWIYNEIFLPLEGTLTGPTPIKATQWVKSYSDGLYKVIQKPQGVQPGFEFYRIDSTLQPASGRPGYLELAADNLYPIVLAGTDATLTARFDALLAAMNALLAS